MKQATEVKKETPAQPAAPVSELEAARKDLAAKDAALADYTDHLKRLQAEFENYCKRTDKERKDVVQHASERLIVKLLLIVDDFDRALMQFRDIPTETRKGLEMIGKNMHKVLDEERVEPIKAVGEKIDPYKHEVLLHAESDKPEDTVIEELQRGYTMNGKVIRYSKVKVSKGKSPSNTHSSGGNKHGS